MSAKVEAHEKRIDSLETKLWLALMGVLSMLATKGIDFLASLPKGGK